MFHRRAVSVIVISFSMASSGCAALSASALRCGTDGDASYVDLVNIPQDISSQSRYFADLCGFAYEVQNEKT